MSNRIVTFVCAALVLVGSTARAGEVNLAAVASYAQSGATPQSEGSFGLGYGARVGYTFGFGGYLGLSLTRPLGDTSFGAPTLGRGGGRGDRGSRFGLASAQLEAGYDFGLGNFTLRPYLGIGSPRSALGAVGRDSGESLADSLGATVTPGLQATYTIVGPLYAGVDVHYALLAGAGTGGIAPVSGALESLAGNALLGVQF